MDVRFLNPFVEAAREVILTEAESNVERGKIHLAQTALTTKEISVILSLIGDVEGVVIYSLSRSTALGIVSKMLGEPVDDFSDLAKSGIAELGNVITGRATMMLTKAGFTSDISPPTVVTGEGVKVSIVDFSQIVVPLITDQGEITVRLSLKPANQADSSSKFIPAQLDRGVLEVNSGQEAERSI